MHHESIYEGFMMSVDANEFVLKKDMSTENVKSVSETYMTSNMMIYYTILRLIFSSI